MGLKRYLIYFSYIGTYFRGVQRQTARGPSSIADPSTIQGLLEIALEQMKPRNSVATVLASRTDQGVHALKSAITADLEFSYEPTPMFILKGLNDFFEDTDLAIRVQEVLQVPWDFNPRRQPLWRKYIYRFATLKPNYFPDENVDNYSLPIPITEYDRCYFVSESKFDVDAVNKVCELFIGTHDFITFLGNPRNQPEDLTTIRCLHQLYVEPANPHVPSSLNDCYNYWHLTCTGRSFLYNQIRRTMAVLLAVGQGKLMYEDVQLMFMEPSPSSYPKSVRVAPASGLYLADIFYDPKDLALPDDIKEKIDEEQVAVEREKTNKKLIKDRLEILKLRREKEMSSS